MRSRLSPIRPGLCGLVLVLALSAAPAHRASAEEWSFVAIGDTAYRTPEDYAPYSALIARINAAKPVLSIHVGDTWGLEECNQESHERILGFFSEYDHPVFYTPGDNEWTDCANPELIPAISKYLRGTATPQELFPLAGLRTLKGAFERRGYGDGLASLAILRKVFFAKAQSLGKRPRPLVRQADGSEFKDMVENALWEHEGVTFGTVHVTGSRNNFYIQDEKLSREAIARNRANLAWIERIFSEAKEKDAKAVVIAMHASIFEDRQSQGEFSRKVIRDGESGPFFWVAWALRDQADRFGKPVLLIHGDFHEFIVDRPFLVSQGEFDAPRFANITRLQVYGSPELRAVRVSVDPDTPWVFGFSPLYE